MTPITRRSAPLLLLLSLAITSACSNVGGPPDRALVALGDLEVPATIAPTDTARIRFTFDVSCGPTPTATISIRPELVEIAVWREIPEYLAPCPAVVVLATREVTLLPSQRAPTVTVRFRQPVGPDSLRTITEVAP
jgi:hypothetical protein